MIDLSDPLAPVQVGEAIPDLFLDDSALGAFVTDRTAVVQSGWGLVVVDLTEPSVPGVTRLATPFDVRGLAAAAGGVVVSTRLGLEAVAIAGGAPQGEPRLLLDRPTSFWGASELGVLDNGTALATMYYGAIQVMRPDESGRLQLDELLSLPFSDPAAAVTGRDALFAGRGGLTALVDGDNGGLVAASVVLPDATGAIARDGSIAWLATWRPGLMAVDVSDPLAPVVLGRTSLCRQSRVPCEVLSARRARGGQPRWMAGKDRPAAGGVPGPRGVGWAAEWLHLVDVSNPRAPFQVASFPTEQPIQAMLMDEYGLLVVEWERLVRYSLESPRAPVLVGEAPVDWKTIAIAPLGDGYLVLLRHVERSDIPEKLLWYDRATLERSTVELDPPRCREAWDLSVNDPYVLIQCTDSALELYRRDDPTAR